VFRGDSVDSFEGVPFTNDHPPEPVTPQNARRYTVGQLAGVPRRDGAELVGTIYVNDASTIEAMRRGKVQLSCGYECDLVEEPGTTPSGERYDARQTNIRGNHVALVDVGRAGTARVRMDAAHMIAGGAGPNTGLTMTLEEALQALGVASARADQAEKDCVDARARADKAEGERDAAKAAELAANKARQDAADAIESRVEARLALRGKAAGVLGASFKFDGLTDREVKVAVIKKLDGDDVAAERSDDYVDGRFDACVARGSAATLGNPDADAPAGKRADAASAEEAARQRMIERTRNAYKTAHVEVK
jgi:hypothetical protein